MTRKVLVSGGCGAGWATWNTEHGPALVKALAEDAELIAMVEAGAHMGTTPDRRWPKATPHNCSPEFLARAIAIARAHGVTDEEWAPYCGGVRGLQVVEVTGLYKINEYGGRETIQEKENDDWW